VAPGAAGDTRNWQPPRADAQAAIAQLRKIDPTMHISTVKGGRLFVDLMI
jgi:hypothetical protein